VLGFRRFSDGEFSTLVPPTIVRCERYLAGAFRRNSEGWPVFSLRSLLESAEFLQAATT
jgi:twitching motility protein PilI